MKFVDIHTHIIPYVDDGSDSWDASMELLRLGAEQGIIALVATPHILSEHDYDLVGEKIINHFEELKLRAKKNKIKIELFLGCEIYAQPDMKLTHRLSTINDNHNYFLVEFPMNTIPRFISEKFFEFISDGKVPIIAHPERNIGFHEKPSLAYEFVQRGVLMQLNSYSLLGKHGEKARSLAYKLISNNLAHVVASDCHHPHRRSITLAESYEVVLKRWGSAKADQLFFENPLKIIHGDAIEIEQPGFIENEPKNFFLKKLNFLKKFNHY